MRVALGLMCAVVSLAVACQPRKNAGTIRTADVGERVSQASDAVRKGADTIDDAAERAVEKSPDVEPEAGEIREETTKLRAVGDGLDRSVKDLSRAEKEIATLQDNLADARAEVKELESKMEAERTGLLRWVFGVLAGFAVVGAVVAVWMLRSLPLAGACGTLLCVSIGAMYLLAWAKWFAVGIAVVLVGLLVFAAIRVVQSRRELVLTAEGFKGIPPEARDQFGALADRVQSKFTQRLVAPVREAMKKRAAEAGVFGVRPS